VVARRPVARGTVRGGLRTIHSSLKYKDIANSLTRKNKNDSEKRSSLTTPPAETLAVTAITCDETQKVQFMCNLTMDNPDVRCHDWCVSGVYR
jgi:hypothetical protein